MTNYSQNCVKKVKLSKIYQSFSNEAPMESGQGCINWECYSCEGSKYVSRMITTISLLGFFEV